MRSDEQTSRHLLLAVVTTSFSALLSLIVVLLAWELWVVPLMLAGCFSVWLLHIARMGSDAFYEYLCAGLMLVEFFFFGIHEATLFDIPAAACILILALFILNKKWILHMIELLYVMELLYHALILHTISSGMELPSAVRLGLGAVVVFGGTALSRFWIKQRIAQRNWYARVFADLETAGKQSAVFVCYKFAQEDGSTNCGVNTVIFH